MEGRKKPRNKYIQKGINEPSLEEITKESKKKKKINNQRSTEGRKRGLRQ
jgi:hypothetical protein